MGITDKDQGPAAGEASFRKRILENTMTALSSGRQPDIELEAMIAASAMDLAIKSLGGYSPSMKEWNDTVVPRAGMIRRWIRTQAHVDQTEVTSLDSTKREYLEPVAERP